jgi:hypothetical protein
VVAAGPWRNGYRRAGGHRLFTANDPEPTGIARLLPGFGVVNPVVAQWETGNNGDCQDSRIVNPWVAGSSPLVPHSRCITWVDA